nr:uncharacterized protein LOC100198186 isoform X2 [Hydra vulgaris]
MKCLLLMKKSISKRLRVCNNQYYFCRRSIVKLYRVYIRRYQNFKNNVVILIFNLFNSKHKQMTNPIKISQDKGLMNPVKVSGDKQMMIPALICSAHTKSVKEQEKFSVQLESPDKRISLLEAQLKSKEQKFSCDLQNAQRIIASLQVELENKSSSIAYLTTQLNKFMNLQGNNVEFSKPTVCPSPPLATPIRRRSSRNKVLSPSASLDGFIHEHYSQEIVTDYVLQNSLPKNNRVKLSSSLISKHSIDDLPSWHYQKLSSKPRPSDYEDFISINQPNVVISKSNIQPLPPITTRSGKKLIEPTTNAKKVLRNRPKATASACGEVEQIIKYNLAEKSCRNAKNSLMKH